VGQAARRRGIRVRGARQNVALTPRQAPFRDGKRILECLQKSLRIASSCIDELTSVQLYVDALDQYIYYFEQGVEPVTPKYINSLVELITSNIDSIHGGDVHPSSQSPPGLVDGVNSPDMIVKVSKHESELWASRITEAAL
jgi:vacuolar protein sorting-associated protein 35